MSNKDKPPVEEKKTPPELEIEITYRRIIKKVGTSYLWRLAKRRATYETKTHGLEDVRSEAMRKATEARDVAIQADKTVPVVSN